MEDGRWKVFLPGFQVLMWFFLSEKKTTKKTSQDFYRTRRISKHLLALSTSSRLSLEHASPTRFNNGVRVG
jgi:hypothetical protein